MKKVICGLVLAVAAVTFVYADRDADYRESVRTAAALGAVAPGYVLVGNASSQTVAVAVSGDITMATNGVATVSQINSVAVATVTDGAALGATAYQPNGTNFLTEGYFDVVNTTQLVFIAAGVTNVVIADITEE